MTGFGFGFGIVGAGVIAATHAQAIAMVPGARLAAVTDTSTDSAMRFADAHGCSAEPDLASLLARDDIDIVTVCVPSGRHAEVGVAAVTAGKHLVVEKPIDVTLEAADRLIGAAGEAGVKLTAISQHRFDRGLVELRSLIDDGALGRLLFGESTTKWYRSQAYYDSAEWRGTWALDGGSLMNQGIHYVDLLLACMGPVTEVTAITATQTHEIEVEDISLALLRFRSGAIGSLTSCTSAFPGFPQRLEVTGTGGTVVLEDGEIVRRGLFDERSAADGALRTGEPGAGASTPAIGAAAHAAQLADFIEAIEQGREPRPSAQDGRAALEVVLAVYQSAREGRVVELQGAG